MKVRAYLINSQFEVATIEGWIAAGWISPGEDPTGQGAVKALSDIDLARAQLIHDLTVGLGVNDEGVPVILDLIDQLHGLRRAMREMIKRQTVD